MEYVSTFRNRLVYIFRINDVEHLGCIKIGEATAPDGFYQPNSRELNKAARQRIDQYTRTAGIRYELLHTEQTAYVADGAFRSFNDKQVHDVLLRSGVVRKEFGTGSRATEWFCCDLETALVAIAAAKRGESSLETSQVSKERSPVVFRPEQLQAIGQTKRVLKKSGRMLWNAKMRMGKTLTSLQVVKEMQLHRTIIVTHRPVVDASWYDDFHKVFYESDTPWLYGSRDKGEGDLERLERSGRHYVYFASLQDLRGSNRVGGNFKKHDDLFDTPWDLLIIDEAHEGTQTPLGKAVQEALTHEGTKVLSLSGTPFNLMEQFDEQTTFTWDYVMEQQAKAEWQRLHPLEHNPYEELPRMNILTFDIGELHEHYADGELVFNFSEFFRTGANGSFVHEADVSRFLDIISTTGTTRYPFSSEALRELFHHTFWIVPGVKEGAALATMLRDHPVFGNYKVVNVAGDEDEESVYSNDALREVLDAIGDKPEETYTITLSCGKLTTGVTVRPWTAVLYLAGSKNTSPQSYMQTIFRVQSPAMIGGQMKTDCYVFDFAPDRTLKMVAEVARISTRAGEAEDGDREALGDFLNFCPIVSCKGTQMLPYDVDQMMQQLKRVYVDKVVGSGFDDGHLYSRRLLNLSSDELETFANLREIIGSTRSNGRTREVVINNQGFDQEEIDRQKKDAHKKEKRELTDKEARDLLEKKRRRQQRDTAVSILRGISIRMPLLIYGAQLESEEESLTLDRFVQLVDDESWREFMPAGVDKEVFAVYKKYYDEDIFAAAGHQIRQLARAADRMGVTDRVKRIAEIFNSFRNPDKETVLTPWQVVNMHMADTVGGYCFYDENYEALLPEPRLVDQGLVTQRLLENSYARVLEVNSKSGLYPLYVAYSLFRHRIRQRQQVGVTSTPRIDFGCEASPKVEQEVWSEVVRENIFIICKTEMARSITQRTLCGFTNAKPNTHVYDDLLNQISNRRTEFISRLLSGSIFKQIKNNMKFDAIVGNPPYQVMDGGAQASATPVYNRFVEVAKALSPRYISMIMPSRWMTGGKGLDGFRHEIIHDRSIRVLHDYADSKELFSNVDIKGGVSYFLRDSSYEGKCTCIRHSDKGVEQTVRYLAEEGDDIFIREGMLIGIKEKVWAEPAVSVESMVSARKPYGLVAETMLSTEKYGLPPFSADPVEGGYRILGLVDGRNRGWRYIGAGYPLPRRSPCLGKWKVFVPEAYGCGEIGEVPSTPVLGTPVDICTETFLEIGPFSTEAEASNFLSYLRTRFFRALVGIKKQTQHTTHKVYRYVPMQDFSHPWTDAMLYAKYGLTPEEQTYLEGTVKEMP